MKRDRNDSAGWKKGALGKYIEPSGVVRGDGWGKGGAGAEKGCGVYQDKDASFLTNKPTGAGTGDTHDILDNVEKNQGHKLRSIKYGVD
jgi:hypothetical protein